MRARTELRSRWRALVSLALIAGIGAGATVAAIAGARRTASVYPRFLRGTNAFDTFIGVSGDQFEPNQVTELNALRSMPVIADSTLLEIFTASVTGPSGVTKNFPDVFPVGGPDGNLGETFNRVKILSGRLSNQDHADEAMMNPAVANALGARVGSVLTLRFPEPAVVRRLRVVGIGLSSGSVDPAAGGYLPLLLLTRAFYEQNDKASGFLGTPVLAVRLHGGRRAVAGLASTIPRTHPDLTVTEVATAQDSAVRRAANFQAIGLEVFAGFTALAVLAIFAQLLARQIFLESNDREALRALGMTRPQMVALSLIRVLAVGVVAAALAAALALALSPLFPISFMRQLEVSPGFRVDAAAIGLGAAGIIVTILIAGVIPAWRATTARRGERAPGTNRVANLLAGNSFPPTAVAGVRMALEPGHGSSAVPVRTTVLGTTLALIALTASLTFGASLRTLVSTPRLSGWNWDATVGFDTSEHLAALMKKVTDEGVVASVVFGDVPDIKVGGLVINALAFDEGPFGPTIISGRRPQGPDEIALGSRVLRRFHSAIGKTIEITPLDPNNDQPVGPAIAVRIVGTTITPDFFFSQTSGGYNAAVSERFVRKHAPKRADLLTNAYVRFAPGVSLEEGVEKINAAAPGGSAFVTRRAESSDLTNLQRLSSLPNVLAGVLALIAAGTLAHTLLSSVRRRRRDVAVLRALGFVRGQVRMTIAWQATTLILVSIAIGLPLGAVAGRWGWRLFVDQLGYFPLPIVPMLSVLLTIPIAAAVANIIASIPARAAARTEPAVVLRAE